MRKSNPRAARLYERSGFTRTGESIHTIRGQRIEFIDMVITLIVGSVVGFSGLLLSTLVQTVTRIRAEERMLEKEFGEAFREYRQNTYCLLPFVY